MKLRVVMERHGRGRVFLDEMELLDVTAIGIECGANRLNTATITFHPAALSIEMNAADVSIRKDEASNSGERPS